MVAGFDNQRVTRLGIAAGVAAFAATAVVLTPEPWLASLVVQLGIPSVLPAATPPLGQTARTILSICAGLFAGGVCFMILRFALDRLKTGQPRQRGVPVLRRADAHPDAPARRPIRASEDLGDPLPMTVPEPSRRTAILNRVPVEGFDLPLDLETPLAALDPEAIPETPREPVRPVAALSTRPQMIDPGERFETFELTPVKRSSYPAEGRTRAEAAVSASIGSLLERLERTARRDVRPHASIEETLGMLRGLATR